MASIKCQECNGDIRKATRACPRCGEPISHTLQARLTQFIFASTFLATVLGLAYLTGIVDPGESAAARPGSALERTTPHAAQSIEHLATDVACNQDLRCLGDKHQMITMVHCLPIIEKSANYASSWTTDWFEPKFSHAIWVNQAHRVVGYIGDKLELQDASGALIPHVYRCDYDIEQQRIVDIKILAGNFAENRVALLSDLRTQQDKGPIEVVLPPQRPTFDCTSPRSQVEKLICTHEELARRDVLLTAMHEDARSNVTNLAQFDKDTQTARQQLEETCFDKACLINWYYHRAIALAAISSHQSALIEPAKSQIHLRATSRIS